jgi:predicted nucleotidyltransferase
MQTQHPLAVVTPTLDGDVLAVLAAADASYTVGSVQKVLGSRSYEGIHKVLTRLSIQGTVTSQRVGSVTSYRLNREHLAAPHIIALANLRAALMDRVRTHVEAWPTPPVWAALFGSAACGQMRPESDLDLFLVDPAVDPERWETLVDQLAREATRWTGNDTRVLSMTEAEVRAGAMTRDPILQSLLDDALTISGEPMWLRRAVARARS